MDEFEQFMQQFEKEEIEITVLIKESCKGGYVTGDWVVPSVNFVASIDNETNELSRKEGRIVWIIERYPQRKGWGYNFKQYGIYRLLVRKCIPIELKENQLEIMNNRYLLVKILEEDVKNDKLQEVKEYLQKPVVIKNELGVFTLDREYSWFECTMDWCGSEVFVTLETDEDCDETAYKAMDMLLKVANNKEAFDRQCKEYAADNLVELANDWLDEDDEDMPDEITRELFMELIEISEICFYSDGSITLYYSDGDMFAEHAIEIDIDEDGVFSNAGIAG